MLIAKTASTALTNRKLLAGSREIPEQHTCFRIIKYCARRHINDEIVSAAPGFLRGAAVFAIVGRKFLILPKRGQSIECGLHLKNHITALAAVTAIRASPRLVLLAAEMHHAVATFAGPYMNCHLINEHAPIITVGASQFALQRIFSRIHLPV